MIDRPNHDDICPSGCGSEAIAERLPLAIPSGGDGEHFFCHDVWHLPIMPFKIAYDGKWTVTYVVDSDKYSSFRVTPPMGKLIAAIPQMLSYLERAQEIIAKHCRMTMTQSADFKGQELAIDISNLRGRFSDLLVQQVTHLP